MDITGDTKIHLHEEYETRVTVKGSHGSFSAELKLCPDGISLKISGDETPLRSWGKKEWKLEQLVCESIYRTFVLFDLHCTKAGSYIIEDGINRVTHTSMHYSAEYAVIARSDLKELNLRSMHIHSPSLSKWIGYTEKQQEIVENQTIGPRAGIMSGLGDLDLFEIYVDCENSGSAGIHYELKPTASPLEFEVGVRFPPVFCFFADNDIAPHDIMPLYIRSYSFLSLLYGDELRIEKIELCDDSPNNQASHLYIPKSRNPRSSSFTYIWFPLAHKLRFNDRDISSFPLESIGRYFSSDYAHHDKWWKYIKYRRMENIEERFLGYFRLLESLTKKSKPYLDPDKLAIQVARAENILTNIFGNRKEVKGFLRGIARYNMSKYNTEKCMLDFYKRLPKSRTANWSLGANDLNQICKLRNDISHANDYYISSEDLLANTTFIESMLLIALLETVDVPIEDSSRMIGYLYGAHLIRPHVL
ncbi:HEPN domain-containing protein [Pseudomonas asplenii]|uniref:Uncharacterized protein n=1 Tax=Pseudomonas asplenii TaxID=53407 RepID=A0A1H6MP16_9PSED|nr:HEPN domain-containing protein [Pseudomonas fuscovaginae]SEH99451.1 hypothetical protein SAMN05216581_1083 [Pseudomonas fuscovaginae]